jgi:BirA family biotin operon repressor/biotin-[acetyl-CoA-carboxylase] ligase
VAAVRALRSCGVPAGLKWPNDLVWNGRKLGGILTAAAVSGRRMKYAVTGIGINVSGGGRDFPAGLRRIAATASQAAGKAVEAGPLFRKILANMDELYGGLRRAGGRKALVDEWSALADITGKNIALREGNRRWTGTIRGFGPDGSLVMLTGKGEKKAFHSGEVTVLDGGQTI